MKRLIQKMANTFGYEIRKIQTPKPAAKPAARNDQPDKRPVGNMGAFLKDLKDRGLRCQSIMDVGANRTHWSRAAQKLFPDAKFCLIEPQVEMQEGLERFCQEFSGSAYFLAGAAAKKETLTLTIWEDLAGSSFLPAADEKLKAQGKQRQIEMLTIDGLIASGQVAMPELMKLDIQGFELEALKGAASTFGKTEAYILEVSLFPFGEKMPVLMDVLGFMDERGYAAYDFPGFLRRPLDGALGQCDICFVKKDGFLRQNKSWG